MHTAMKLVTAPSVEPVDLTKAKSSARIDGDTENADVEAMIVEAREDLEAATARAFITQIWRLTLDRFPRDPIELKVCPVQLTGCEIQYFDAAGTLQTIDPDVYVLDADSEPGRIFPKPNQFWPTTDGRMSGITITFTAGYGDDPSDVPENVKRAIKLLVGDRYRHRDATSTRKGADDLFQKLVRRIAWGSYP